MIDFFELSEANLNLHPEILTTNNFKKPKE